jgi:glycosyltransferase involved in cell wall biosynthesis
LESHHIDATAGESANHVSIVIPVYNESSRLGSSLASLAAFLDEEGVAAEVIVADDGSTDATARIAREHACAFRALRLLDLPHGGKARAVLAGLDAARSPVVGFMDADLATPLPTLVAVMDCIAAGADVVIGSREGEGSHRIGEPGYRHVMGRVFNWLVRILLLDGIDDTQCGFKFMTRDARDRILPLVRLYRDGTPTTQPRVTAFDVELLYIARRLQMRIEVLPVTWSYGNSSKVNPIRDTLQNLRDVMQVWLNGRRGAYEGGE